MAQSCRLLSGFFLSVIGWIGIIIATSTNDWVVTCSYGTHTCKKMEKLESKGLWAECVISASLYHCESLNQILALPAYIQSSRALMISASLLGLPSVMLMLLAMPCVKMGHETEGTKRVRGVVGGILILLMSVCGMVSTVWFPIGVHQEDGLMSFGFSLYAGWLGSTFCFLGGSLMICCFREDPAAQHRENHFYYSKQSGLSNSNKASNNHAKSAHV